MAGGAQLVKMFGVMKSDQHIYFNGNELDKDSSTLGQYLVTPGSLLLLLVSPPQALLRFLLFFFSPISAAR